ncbi:hypothetical protein ANN_17104 [Periplaneta americana]|uniref:DUF4817 domain-containing protein n=1 Tax=Periplaneta americana TaxID=6978 RepID=A0ABQ8STF1_PERAM|nr:hypothetical protein ANN_17104 [Periplaneta americana]
MSEGKDANALVTLVVLMLFKIKRFEREYRRVFNHDAPTATSIKKWHDTSLATGSVLKKHGGGRRTSDEMVANVQSAYERSPRKSLRRASRELQVPKSTLQRIVHKCLKLYANKVQLMQRYYATPVRDLRDLRERITKAIESIPEDMLQRAWQEIVHRLDIVTITLQAAFRSCWPPWNVVKRRWMASATSTRGGPTRGRSFASNRQGALGKVAEAGMVFGFLSAVGTGR